MSKMLVVDYELCTGCRLCEVVCSVAKEGVSDPSKSRIRVIKWEMEGLYLPMFCAQCEDPMCSAVCPVNAVEKDTETGRVTTAAEVCIGCRACVSVCPFGGVAFDAVGNRTILRCDLCDGDPTCVKFCETKALRFEESEKVQRRRQRSAAERLYQALRSEK